MIEYFLATGKREIIQDVINTKLSEGWSLYGSGYYDAGNGYHVQPMTRNIEMVDITKTERQIKGVQK